MVESGVDNAWRHPIGHLRAQRRLARTALEAYPVAIAKAAVLRVVRMDFEPIFGMPCDIFLPARLRPDIILAKNAQIGRASCRERVCQYVSISVGAVSLKKNIKTTQI